MGAVLVVGGEVIASRGNERERRHDPTAHAEMLVLRDAAGLIGGWRLKEATLYVTLEPCAMCAGAIVLARIKRLVYGADDPKAGAAGTIFNIVDHPALNHQPEVRAGVMAIEAARLLREFFAEQARARPPVTGAHSGRTRRRGLAMSLKRQRLRRLLGTPGLTRPRSVAALPAGPETGRPRVERSPSRAADRAGHGAHLSICR